MQGCANTPERLLHDSDSSTAVAVCRRKKWINNVYQCGSFSYSIFYFAGQPWRCKLYHGWDHGQAMAMYTANEHVSESPSLCLVPPTMKPRSMANGKLHLLPTAECSRWIKPQQHAINE